MKTKKINVSIPKPISKSSERILAYQVAKTIKNDDLRKVSGGGGEAMTYYGTLEGLNHDFDID